MCTVNSAKKDSWYSKLFARIYDPFMATFEARVLQSHRQDLLKDTSGRVLEIGAGTGINFPFYPTGTKVLAIEPSYEMFRQARQRAELLPDNSVKVIQKGIGDTLPEGERFDFIVCTLVLCTIPDPEAAICTIKKLLQPNGTLLILEHVASADNKLLQLQQFINPLWKKVAEGCHLTRQTELILKQQGFISETEEKFKKGLPFYKAKGHFAKERED